MISDDQGATGAMSERERLVNAHHQGLWPLFGGLELMKLIFGVAATSTTLHGLSGGRDEGRDRHAK